MTMEVRSRAAKIIPRFVCSPSTMELLKQIKRYLLDGSAVMNAFSLLKRENVRPDLEFSILGSMWFTTYL
jgi:hypothetical protein